MSNTSITFSVQSLHGNSFSWSFGAVCGEACQDLKFIETSNPDFSAIHVSICDSISSWLDEVVFRIASQVESCYAHCKSFFVESPFVRPVKKAVAALKKVTARGFRKVSESTFFKGGAAQANLGIFTL